MLFSDYYNLLVYYNFDYGLVWANIIIIYIIAILIVLIIDRIVIALKKYISKKRAV